MIITATLLLAAAAAAPVAAGIPQGTTNYTLVDSFTPSNFFQEFNFFSGGDPTNGFVDYVDAATASQAGLAGYASDGVYLGVDYKNKVSMNTTAGGRQSTRVESKKSWTKGLFIADIRHMPSGAGDSKSCGLWPAFWFLGPNWPENGEIDIIEGINTQQSNFVVLHTAKTCKVANTGALASTKLLLPECQGHIGCKQQPQGEHTFGAGFNAAGGGVYIMEWTDQAISTWFFPRGNPIANSLTTGANSTLSAPDPAKFGQPHAKFVGDGCSIQDSFKDQSIIINTALCGDWAGKDWTKDATCKTLAPTCNEFVANTPEAFTNAYWVINSIRVFQQGQQQKPKVPYGRRGAQAVSFSA